MPVCGLIHLHDYHRLHLCREWIARRDASSHQRHKPTAAGDFEFAEDRVNVLFHRRQTQAGVIGDFLRACVGLDARPEAEL
jgi:hypothetical protein